MTNASHNAAVSQAFGTTADLQAGVNIGQVYGGYFSDPKNISMFCEIGIKPIISSLRFWHINYADLGGGQGNLARGVSQCLTEAGKVVWPIIVDSNPQFVEDARRAGFNAIVCDIGEYAVSRLQLMTMRSVLHYNAYPRQLEILRRAYDNLETGGALINQFTTGSKEACSLRSDLVNSALLSRSKSGDGYHWVTVEEYLAMSKQAGFSSQELAGYAENIAWGPKEQWYRFYGKALAEAETHGHHELVATLTEKRQAYLAEANRIIEQYLSRSSAEHLGVEEQVDGNYLIRSTYPIVVSRKD